MATPRENELRELLDGAARLLEENERMEGPGFRSHSLRQEIASIQRELDRERWAQRSTPQGAVWDYHSSIEEYRPVEVVVNTEVTMTGLRQILNEAYPRQLIEQELRRPNPLWDQLSVERGAWQGAPLEIPFTTTGRWAGEAPQAQELPRELRIMGCLVRAEATCSDRHVYAVPQTHPVRMNRSYGGSFAEEWRLGAMETVIQSVQTPGQSMAWHTEPPDRQLVDGVLSLISNLRREAGNANVNPELLCSPRTYSRLHSAWTLLETGQSPAPLFLLGKESQTFEDEMDAALQAFQQDRKSA